MIINLLVMLALAGGLLGTISQRAIDTRSKSRQGKPGQWVERSTTDEYFTGLNQSPQAVQISTITVGGATNSKQYVVTINGVDVKFTSSGAATVNNIAAGIAAAVNASPYVRGVVTATVNSAVVTLTGVTPGYVVTLVNTNADGQLTLATTQSAAVADPIPFGRLLIKQGFQTGEGEQLVAIAKSSLLTAQVQTWTLSFVSTAILQAKLYEKRGTERIFVASAIFASATDLPTTTAGLATACTNKFPANTVTVTSTATAVVFTAAIAGYEFDVEINHTSTGAEPTTSVQNTTGPNQSTSIHQALAGLSAYSHADPAPIGSDDGQYAANAGVIVAKRGLLYVESDEVITSSSPVYVELGVSADYGQLFATSSATRVQLSGNRVAWVRDGNTAADSIAVARLTL